MCPWAGGGFAELDPSDNEGLMWFQYVWPDPGSVLDIEPATSRGHARMLLDFTFFVFVLVMLLAIVQGAAQGSLAYS